MVMTHRRQQVRELFVKALKPVFENTGLATVNTLFLPLPTSEIHEPWINVRTPDDSLNGVYQTSPYATERDISVEIMLVVPIDPLSQAIHNKLDNYCLLLENAILPYLGNEVQGCDLTSSKTGADTQPKNPYGFIQNLYTVRWREEYTIDESQLPALQTIIAGWDLAPSDGRLEATDTITFVPIITPTP